MIRESLLEKFIPVSRIFDNEFLYFPGIFENPAPGVKTSCQRNINFKKYLKYYKISTIYECVEKLSMIIGCNI